MLKGFVGVLLAPAACAALLAAARTTGDLALHARLTLPFLLGFLGYPVFRVLAVQPLRLYVLGHELSHAIAAWMSGARVFGFSVGSKGGHVDLSESNAFISLAPYILPVYAVGIVFAYRLLLWIRPPSAAWGAYAHGTFLAAVGLALSFHLVHTAEALWTRRQPDLDQAGGILFSLVLIALLNGLSLILALKCLFPGVVSTERGLVLIWTFTRGFWLRAAYLSEAGIQWIWGRVARGAA